MTDPKTTPTADAVNGTLTAIDSLITDWQDWEAEDAKPNQKAAQLRKNFDALRPFFARAATPVPCVTAPAAAAVQDILDAAIYWTSEDADRPDPASPEWQAVIPMIQHAPAMVQLLRDAQGAMSSLRHQVDQMRGMFPDGDGTIQEACDAHDGTEEAIQGLLDGIGDGHETGTEPVMQGPA